MTGRWLIAVAGGASILALVAIWMSTFASASTGAASRPVRKDAPSIQVQPTSQAPASGPAHVTAPLAGLPPGAQDIDPLPERMMRLVGRTQPVTQETPALAGIREAIAQRTHPERLSPAIAPAAFDPHAYAADEARYLALVEPGRVFQVLQPGPEVPRLQAETAQDVGLVQQVPLELAVRAMPGAPVSFTSFDLAHFQENGLSAITVKADDQGVARVHVVAGPGCFGRISVLAGCPLTAGQVTFVGVVEQPQQWRDLAAAQGGRS